MKKRYFIIVFILAFLVGVIVNVPVGILAEDGRVGDGVQLYGVSGSLWKGSADIIRFNNNPENDIKLANWSLNALYLLIGKVNLDLSFSYLEGKGSGNVSVGLDRNVVLSNANIDIVADKLTQKFAQGFVGLEGDIFVTIDKLQYQMIESLISGVSGNMTWQSAGVAYPISGAFGNLSAIITQDEESQLITADVTNVGGEVDVSGKATLDNKRYNVDLSVKLRENASDAMKDNLDGFLSSTRDGEYVVSHTGSI